MAKEPLMDLDLRYLTHPPKPKPNGRRKVSKAAANLSEIGVTGLSYNSGMVMEEFHPNLQGSNAIRVYEEMSSNDPTVGASLSVIDMMIRRVTWTVERNKDGDGADEKAFDLVESAFDDMSHPWSDYVSEILTMIPFGWSYHEIVYKRRNGNNNSPGKSSRFDDGLIGWRKFAPRAQTSLLRWDFDETGGLNGMIQLGPPDYKEHLIPIEKALHFRTKLNKNNPEGVSALRPAYRPWFFLKRVEEYEAVGIERDLAGLPRLRVPASMLDTKASADEKAALVLWKKMLKSVRRGEQDGVILPSDTDVNGKPLFEFDLMTSGGRRQFDTNAVVSRYAHQIAISMLTEFMFLGLEGVGSFALSKTKVNIFLLAIETMLGIIEDVMNKHAIPRILRLNGMEIEHPPQLTHGELEGADLAALGDYLGKLAAAGMPLFPDEGLENVLRGLAGLPQLSEADFQERETERQAEEQMRMEGMQLELDMQGQALKDGANQSKEESQETQKRLDLIREALLAKAAQVHPLSPITVNVADEVKKKAVHPGWEIQRNEEGRIVELVPKPE